MPTTSRTMSSPTDLVDVTADIFASTSHLQGRVAKSPYFELIEGARALEASNHRLDTSLIELSAEEVDFDPEAPQTPEHVGAVMDQLLVAYCSWITALSLPLTVLSCRYVYAYMDNYMKKGSLAATFHEERAGRSPLETDSHHSKLVNVVLRAFVAGVCKLVGITIQTGSSVLYDEEDLTLRTLSYDFLSGVATDDVYVELDLAAAYLLKHNEHDLLKYIAFLKHLFGLWLVLHLSIDIFHGETDVLEAVTPLEVARQAALAIKTSPTASPPKGSFSMFVQLDADNPSFPNALYSLDRGSAFDKLGGLFQQVHDFTTRLAKVRTTAQLLNFLQFDIAFAINNDYHPLARGLFQLFLFRDDTSLVGLPRELLHTLTRRVMDFSTYNSQIIRPETWSVAQDKKAEISAQIERLMGDLALAVYNLFTIYANNRSRQRQLYNKNIVVWDTLQVHSETLEIQLWEKYAIGDKLYEDNGDDANDLALPVTSFIYYAKIKMMLETTLNGFELDIYNLRELGQMYWYASYLLQLVIQHLSGRVAKILQSKIHTITTVMPKRIKKLKAGPKKQALKEQHASAVQDILPQLEKYKTYYSQYAVLGYQAIQMLTDAVRTEFVVFDALDLLPKQRGPASPELLYNARMKPFSLVGVPSLPTYAYYAKAMSTDFLKVPANLPKFKVVIGNIVARINQAKELFSKLVTHVEKLPVGEYLVHTDNLLTWYRELVKTCVWHCISLKSLEQIIASDKFDSKHYTLTVEPGYHRYFPKVSIAKK